MQTIIVLDRLIVWECQRTLRINYCKIFCCYSCQRQLLYKWRDQQQGCTKKSFKYDILDAIISLATDNLLYIYDIYYHGYISALLDLIFDQAYSKSFHESLKSLQYNASLTIPRAIRGTTKQNFNKNQVQNLLSTGVDFANSAFSTSFLKINLRVTFTSNYLFKPPLKTQDRLEIYPFSLLNTIYLKILISLCNI